jgi:hypothetical protein
MTNRLKTHSSNRCCSSRSSSNNSSNSNSNSNGNRTATTEATKWKGDDAAAILHLRSEAFVVVSKLVELVTI